MSTELIQVDTFTLDIEGHETSLETALTAVFDDGHVGAEAEARQEAARLEREEAEQIYLRRKAGSILKARGHEKAGQILLDNEAVGEEDRPHLESAVRDERVPFSIKTRQLFPRLNALDIVRLANGPFGAFVEEIALAAQALFGTEQPDTHCAAEALDRAEDIRAEFDRRTMSAIERALVHAELPRLDDLLREYQDLAFAAVCAKDAAPRKRASALLRELKQRLWRRIESIRSAQRHSERQREPARTQARSPKRKGKTARKREKNPNRETARRARQLERAGKGNTPSTADGKKKKK